MQVIILAAGYGTRMRPLTYHVPKPMIRAGGKNFIEHNIDKLPESIDEIIIVVGYLAEQVKNHFGDEFQGRKITYVKQKKMLGTGHAIDLCKKYINGKFLVLMGDDICSKNDINVCLENERSMMVKKVKCKFSGGKVIYDDEGHLQDIKEGVHEGGGYINTNVFVLTPEYFNYEMVSIKNGEEFGLPQTVIKMAKDYPIKIVESTDWRQMSDLDDVKNFEKLLKKK